jgi:hypothetical protein
VAVLAEFNNSSFSAVHGSRSSAATAAAAASAAFMLSARRTAVRLSAASCFALAAFSSWVGPPQATSSVAIGGEHSEFLDHFRVVLLVKVAANVMTSNPLPPKKCLQRCP